MIQVLIDSSVRYRSSLNTKIILHFMRLNLLFISVFCSLMGYTQVTLRVTSIPSNTPANATIYAVGSFNNWNPADPNAVLQPDGQGALIFTIPEGQGQVQYKFTRGSWATVEGNANGGFLPNRTFSFNGNPQTLNLSILTWEDLGGNNNSTAAANVQIMSNAFFMPQLNRSRRIWIYLPPDYNTTNKHYPVIYMKDGQNLFDQATSFSGEWQVDETLNTLFSQGDYGAIVVGIDNGGSERLNEYSPWVNASYGGGQGLAYMTFVAETLKPHIDATFRTLPQGSKTVLFGSSMGALISTYGALAYANVFQKVGSFSPAYWFALNDLTNYISNFSASLSTHRICFIAGQNESATMGTHMNAIRNGLQQKGLTVDNTFYELTPNGTHTESFWRSKFGQVYQWLFADETLSFTGIDQPKSEVYQVGERFIYASGWNEKPTLTLYDISGKCIMSTPLENGTNDVLTGLTSGYYVGVVQSKNQIQNIKIVVNCKL